MFDYTVDFCKEISNVCFIARKPGARTENPHSGVQVSNASLIFTTDFAMSRSHFPFLLSVFSAAVAYCIAPLFYIPAFAFHAARSVSIQSPVVRTSTTTSNTQLYTLRLFITVHLSFLYDRSIRLRGFLHRLPSLLFSFLDGKRNSNVLILRDFN